MQQPTKKIMRNDTKITKVKCVSVNESEKGFSLLELVVSIVIFLVVIAAIFGVLQAAQRSRTVVNEGVQLSKTVRISLNLIGRDTLNAGYAYPSGNTVVLKNNALSTLIGIPSDFDSSRDTVPPIIVGNDVTLNTFNQTPNTRTDQVTFLFKDSTFNLVGTAGNQVSQPLNINAATTSSGIDEIIPVTGSNASCQINDLFVITGNTGSTLGVVTNLSGTNKVQFANGDILGFNRTGTSGFLRNITTPASMQRVQMVTYFVTADGTLTRRRYANGAVAFVDEPLVYGVENFQIQYVMNNGDLLDNPSAGPDGTPGTSDDVEANLALIRQLRVTIFVRSTELNAAGQPFSLTMSSTFSTRNLGYDAN